METDELLSELQTLTSFVTRDMTEISQTLEFLETNYISSLSFFKSFENSLQTIQQVYEGYNLHILVYSGLFVIATLLVIKFSP